jgi:hypothetical protein
VLTLSQVIDTSDDGEDFGGEDGSICTSINATDTSAEPEAGPALERPDYGSDEAIASVEGILIEEEPEEDILAIAAKLLKQAAKVHTKKTLKNIMMLTAIVSYEKLCQMWKSTGARRKKTA